MTLDTILKAAAGGGVVILLLTCVEVSRIKINPWSAIGKFFKWLLGLLGHAANREVLVKLDEVTHAQQEARKKLDKLETRLDKHIVTDARRDADKHRMEILQFNNTLLRNRRHTKEEFIEIISHIDAYEAYCKSDKNYPNNRVVLAIENIREVLEDGRRDDE